MKIKDWFLVQKEKRAAKKQTRLKKKLMKKAGKLEPLGADTEGIEQPDSRFTEEYKEFLDKQDAPERAVEKE